MDYPYREDDLPVMGVPTSNSPGRPAIGIPVSHADEDGTTSYIYGSPAEGNPLSRPSLDSQEVFEDAEAEPRSLRASSMGEEEDKPPDPPGTADRALADSVPSLEPPSRVTATFIPVLPPPEPPPEQRLTAGQEMMQLLAQGRG